MNALREVERQLTRCTDEARVGAEAGRLLGEVKSATDKYAASFGAEAYRHAVDSYRVRRIFFTAILMHSSSRSCTVKPCLSYHASKPGQVWIASAVTSPQLSR